MFNLKSNQENGAGTVMQRAYPVLIAMVAASFLTLAFPIAAYSSGEELEGEISLGAELFSPDHKSAKFGEYSNISDKSTKVLGDIELEYDREATYFELEGRNLGVDYRDVEIEAGKYGSYEVKLKYDQLPLVISTDAKTIFDGAGSGNLTLPEHFESGSQTKDMVPSLEEAARQIVLKVDRKTMSAGIDVPFGIASFDMGFKQIKRDGTQPLAGGLGISGGNNRAVDLPVPVKYTTNDFTAGLTFKNEMGLARIEYAVSSFSNADKFIDWQNPFAKSITNVNYPDTARTSLPPNNTSQRVGFTGSVDLPMNTRATALADFGSMKQNESLLDYTINPAATINTGLPRNSASAEIATTHYFLSVASRPVSPLGLNLSYRHMKVDNKTKVSLFQYIPGDNGVVQDGTNGSHALHNLAPGTSTCTLKFDANYRVASGVSLLAGWNNEAIARTYREVSGTKENTFWGGVNANAGILSASLKASTGDRKHDGDYSETMVYDAYHSEDYVATVNPNVAFDNHPLMRKFDIANRKRTKTSATVTLMPTETFSLGAYYTMGKDNYSQSILGLTKSETNSVTIDATVMLGDSASLFAYYTSENIKSAQASRNYRGNAKATESVDENRNWWADHDDKVPTFGLGSTFFLMDDELRITAHMAQSTSTSAISFRAGSALNAPVNMPDMKTSLTSLNLSGKYRVSHQWSIGMGYEYEKYSSERWTDFGVEPASKAILDVITMVGETPNYTAHIGRLYVTYVFGE